MSTPVNKNDMRLATIRQSIKYGLTYDSFPFDSFPCDSSSCDEEEIVIPPLQQNNVVYDSPPLNQIMAGDPLYPPSNQRPPMREHLANEGYVPQRLDFQAGATQQSPSVPLSGHTKAHRSLNVSVACIQLDY